VYIKIIKRRNFGFVFFIFPYSEIENGFQDYFAQTKTKTQKKKIFFLKYTPRSIRFNFLSSGEKHKVYSLLVSQDNRWEGLHPHLKQRAADRRRGRSFHKEKSFQKIFVQNDE
jgi:hypothetical protein